jgi:hypothetical protein
VPTYWLLIWKPIHDCRSWCQVVQSLLVHHQWWRDRVVRGRVVLFRTDVDQQPLPQLARELPLLLLQQFMR